MKRDVVTQKIELVIEFLGYKIDRTAVSTQFQSFHVNSSQLTVLNLICTALPSIRTIRFTIKFIFTA